MASLTLGRNLSNSRKEGQSENNYSDIATSESDISASPRLGDEPHKIHEINPLVDSDQEKGIDGEPDESYSSFLRSYTKAEGFTSNEVPYEGLMSAIALMLSVSSLVVAYIPVIAFIVPPELRPNAMSERMIHQMNKNVTRPDITYKFEPAVLDSDRYDGHRETFYVNGYYGWRYTWQYDFIDNGQEWQGYTLYPLSDIRVKYGDRLIFRSTLKKSRDPVVLVPRGIWESCDFADGNYSRYYLDDEGKINKSSPFYLAEGESLSNDLKDEYWLGNHSNGDWYAEWNQFEWNIRNNSHLLPCAESYFDNVTNETVVDLWCRLMTDDVLYFVSSYNWDRTWGESCKGSLDTSLGGLKLKVIIEGATKDMKSMEADPNAMLDHEAVQDMEYAIGSIGRALILSHFDGEQRVRSEGDSGLTNVRGHYDGDAAYDDGTYTNGAVASIHDHSDNMLVVGIGEIAAVLNGVEFQTRHNDYNLRMPSTTSGQYGATEPIPYPDVPPEVLSLPTVNEQVLEMQEWFRAFKDQDVSHRDYRPYFRPILCYVEGTWILDDSTVKEPFDSDRHQIEAKTWQQLHDKIRWMANSGRKNLRENLAHLPSSIRNLVNDTFPVISNWEYRIVCHPLKNDVSTERFRIVDDLSVQLMGSPRTRDELRFDRRARFDLNKWIAVDDPDGEPRWSSGRKRWNYLDYLMEQIPGKDNYGANITDELPDGTQQVIQFHTDETVNAGFYSRFYGLSGSDAMGSSKHRRGWADRYMFAAKTTQEKVSPVSFDYEMDDENGDSVYHHTVSRWSYAIPLEIIYQTPLSRWNPHNITYFEDRSLFDYDRSGTCESTETAFNGYASNNAYFTPAAFFDGVTSSSAADTHASDVCALDENGEAVPVYASGHWITFPEIANGVGKIRQRYPIFPIHNGGSAAFKELKALQNMVLRSDYDNPKENPDGFFGDSRDVIYGFELNLQGGGHQHVCYLQGWRIKHYWWSEDGDSWCTTKDCPLDANCDEREGHSHTVKVWRQQVHDDNGGWTWKYHLRDCRFGSLSDHKDFTYPDDWNAMDEATGEAKCADLHGELIR